MSDAADIEAAAIARFLKIGFAADFTPNKVTKAEQTVIDRIVTYVQERFDSIRYVIGLALDFTLVAQRVSHFDPAAKDFRPKLDETILFAHYPQTVSSGDENVNTLTLTVQDGAKKKKIGIRSIEEKVCDLFIAADRSGYPSAYVYNTGMWHHYKPLLVDCFQLSESGRYILAQRLIDFGLAKLPRNTFFGRPLARARLFEIIIAEYDRAATAGEVAGMLFQGIAYGYVKADRPHLSLIVDKSRTGSARQRRFGDIDGYYGLDLEIAVEVKDGPITTLNVESELGQFAKDVKRHGVRGLAFVHSAHETAQQWLGQFGVLVQTQAATLASVQGWDWQKQDMGVQGLLHFLAHVEQKPEAVTRLLTFIWAKDRSHDSLAYYKSA